MRILITLLALTITASSYTKAQLYELNNLKATGRAAYKSYVFYNDKAQAAGKKVKEYEEKIEDKKKELVALWKKAKCRLKESCDHSRKKPCYKYARSLKSIPADIKRYEETLNKYKKSYNTNKKFADSKKKSYDIILADYKKKLAKWKKK